MLVLTRRGGESVRIGDDVTVTVLGDRALAGAYRDRCAEGDHGSPRRRSTSGSATQWGRTANLPVAPLRSLLSCSTLSASSFLVSN